MDLMDEAAAVLDEHGVLDRLGELIRQVYRRAADRHEPELGDDAMSFGTTVWRNLVNLGKAEFTNADGVRARIEDNSLELLCAGYVLRLYSLQGNVESIRWEGSEVRLGGAVENSRDEQLAFDDEEQFRDIFAQVVPAKRHIRVAHGGDMDTGAAFAYLGLPRDNREGGSPWFDVRLWFGEPPSHLAPPPLTATSPQSAPRPRHDELPIPELDLAALRPGRTAGGAASA